MKKLAKKILPQFFISFMASIFLFFKRMHTHHVFRRMYRNDMMRYLKYSRTLSNDNSTKMIGAIVLQYHVIEKGLTMPDTRLGFAQERIIPLCNACINYIQKYGQDDEQLQHAIGVILEYREYHEYRNFPLEPGIISAINELKGLISGTFGKTTQIQTTKGEYFKNINSSFPGFSNSRASVRNYSDEDIPIEKIQQSLDLARNAPSACNRQCWRTYVYTDKNRIIQILEKQGGNRGFGHLANKLIIIAGELGLFCNSNERNQVYIDGGIYSMNLLYALHNNEIAACIMNCSFDYLKEREIKEFAGIKESEVLIAMIACGVPPGEFKVALSPRYSIDKSNTVIK